MSVSVRYKRHSLPAKSSPTGFEVRSCHLWLVEMQLSPTPEQKCLKPHAGTKVLDIAPCSAAYIAIAPTPINMYLIGSAKGFSLVIYFVESRRFANSTWSSPTQSKCAMSDLNPLSTRMPVFQHEVLDLEEDSKRVLRVTSSMNGDNRIACTLEHTRIQDCQYTALSCRWGEEDVNCCIEINGQELKVRENLHQFLRQAQSLYPSVNLWIDAIGIDQSNVTERNHQVRQMGRIYSQAQEVAAWLGYGNDAIRFVVKCFSQATAAIRIMQDNVRLLLEGLPPFEFLEKYYRHYEIRSIISRDSPKRRLVTDKTLRPSGKKDLIIDAILDHLQQPDVQNFIVSIFDQDYSLLSAVHHLCLLSYWPRLWVIQEILLAKSLTLLYGDIVVSWNDFWSGINAALRVHGNEIVSDTHAYSHFKARFARIKLVGTGTKQQAQTLHNLLLSYSRAQCSDIRDRVIGLLSLADQSQTFAVDYNESAVMLACRTATHFEGVLSFFAELLRALEVKEGDLWQFLSNRESTKLSRGMDERRSRAIARLTAALSSSGTLPRPLDIAPGVPSAPTITQTKSGDIKCTRCRVEFFETPPELLSVIGRHCTRVICLGPSSRPRHVFQFFLQKKAGHAWSAEWAGPVDCSKHTSGSMCPRWSEWQQWLKDWKQLWEEAKDAQLVEERAIKYDQIIQEQARLAAKRKQMQYQLQREQDPYWRERRQYERRQAQNWEDFRWWWLEIEHERRQRTTREQQIQERLKPRRQEQARPRSRSLPTTSRRLL